jgi:hypothetical protein
MRQENPKSMTPSDEDVALDRAFPSAARTIRRILAEAFFVALLGALVFGISAEMHFLNVGFIIAVIIWVAGTPTLEVIRLLQSRR